MSWPDAVELQSGALSTAGSALFVAKGLSHAERVDLLRCFSAPFDRLAQEFGINELAYLKKAMRSDLITLRSQMVTNEISAEYFLSPEKMFAPRLREIVGSAQTSLQNADKALLHCLSLTAGIKSAELLNILGKILGEVRIDFFSCCLGDDELPKYHYGDGHCAPLLSLLCRLWTW